MSILMGKSSNWKGTFQQTMFDYHRVTFRMVHNQVRRLLRCEKGGLNVGMRPVEGCNEAEDMLIDCVKPPVYFSELKLISWPTMSFTNYFIFSHHRNNRVLKSLPTSSIHRHQFIQTSKYLNQEIYPRHFSPVAFVVSLVASVRRPVGCGAV